MSFKKIIEIKKLGIFDDYSWKCHEEFKENNIFFGFNGSGKTILSSLFNLISRKENFSQEKKTELFSDLKRDDNAKFRISYTNSEILTYPPTEGQNNKNIYVFNTNFIADHVFDGQQGRLQKFNVVETVLEDPEIKTLNNRIETESAAKKTAEDSQKQLNERFNDIKRTYNQKFIENFQRKQLRQPNFPSVADLPQKSKEVIEKEINQKVAEIKLAEKQQELESDIKAIEGLTFLTLKFDIDTFFQILESSVKENAQNKVKEKIGIFQKNIESEKKNEIEPWYKLGQQLLEKSKVNERVRCPLCDTDLSLDIEHILKEFGDYFDKSYEEFIQKLTEQEKILYSDEHQISANATKQVQLKEYSDKYEKFINDKFPNIICSILTEDISSLKRLFSEKRGNVGIKLAPDLTSIKEKFNSYNQDVEKLIGFRNQLASALKNQKINPDTIEEEIRKLYASLVCHDLNEGQSNNIENYHRLTQHIGAKEKTINELTNQKVQRLKGLKMESRKVSEYLIKLGIHNFTIDLNEENEAENILIKYKDDDKIKHRLRNTLSEGEKTALAFAYFVSKVNTEVNDKQKVIVVIDDPISSLDDNRLYQTSYLIHEEFIQYRQLFVLSHNLLFLKYLNSLFKPNRKSCFFINQGLIEDLPKSLHNFQSPYFYLLENLIDFKNNPTPDYEEARKYLPNYIRRILETFLSFRYAQLMRDKNPNQSPGLDDFIGEYIKFDELPELTIGTTTKTNIKDKLSNINKICDNFSHGNPQHLDECNFLTDSALKQISTETLEILDFFDGLHYKRVEDLVSTIEPVETTAV
jgi:wobble nucleotide-excising tRNase